MQLIVQPEDRGIPLLNDLTANDSGTAYRAANWVCIGITKGRGKLEKHHQSLLSQKAIFLYPLRPDFKKILPR